MDTTDIADERADDVRRLLRGIRDDHAGSAGSVEALIGGVERRRRRRGLATLGAGLAASALVIAGSWVAQDRLARVEPTLPAGVTTLAAPTPAAARSLDDPLVLGVLPADSELPSGYAREFPPTLRPTQAPLRSLCDAPKTQPVLAVSDAWYAAAADGPYLASVQQFSDAAAAAAYATGPARSSLCMGTDPAAVHAVSGQAATWAWTNPEAEVGGRVGTTMVVGRSVIMTSAHGTDRKAAQAAARLADGIRQRLAGAEPLTPIQQLKGTPPVSASGIPAAVLYALPGLAPEHPYVGLVGGGVDDIALRQNAEIAHFQQCDSPRPGTPAPIDRVVYTVTYDEGAADSRSVTVRVQRFAAGQGASAWAHLVAGTLRVGA